MQIIYVKLSSLLAPSSCTSRYLLRPAHLTALLARLKKSRNTRANEKYLSHSFTLSSHIEWMNKKSSANVQIRNSSRRPRLARFVFFILNIWVPLWWARNFFHAFHFATLVHSLAHGAAAVRQCWVCFISIFFFLFSRMNMMNEMKHEKMRKFRWDSDFKINMWRVEFFFSLILCSLLLREDEMILFNGWYDWLWLVDMFMLG